MNLESTLYKIISGRTRIFLGGFFVYIREPDSRLIARSYEIYDEVYESAYHDGLYIEEEIKNLLIEQDIWTPLDDREFDKVKTEIDDKKVEVYENWQNPRAMKNAKYQLLNINKRLVEMGLRRASMDHLSCHYSAESARNNWILLKCSRVNKKPLLDSDLNINTLNSLYLKKAVSSSRIRELARNDTWRTIWHIGKMQKSKLFNREVMDYSREQLTLCSFSTMYDNVYENPERPDEKVIEDDDCLDGWFISQRRKNDNVKKQRNAEDLIKNPKIKNAKEVFMVAQDDEHAKNVYNANTESSKAIIEQRTKVIEEKGKASDLDFPDVQIEQSLIRNNISIETMRRK